MQHLSFCAWLISPTIMSSRVIHIVCVRMSFLSEAKWYSIVWMGHTVFSHISFKRWIDGRFYCLVPVNCLCCKH